jgi:hypothetical protein
MSLCFQIVIFKRFPHHSSAWIPCLPSILATCPAYCNLNFPTLTKLGDLYKSQNPSLFSILNGLLRAVMAQLVEYWATGWMIGGSRVQFLVRAGNFYLHHCIQNGSGAHPASYPMGTRGSFPGGKVAGV